MIKVNPTNSEYRYSLAKLKFEKGKLFKGTRDDDAYFLFKKVLMYDPNHLEAVLKMANIHVLKFEWLQASKLLSVK